LIEAGLIAIANNLAKMDKKLPILFNPKLEKLYHESDENKLIICNGKAQG